MENIFDTLFPLTGKKAESNKVIKLEMLIEKLKLSLRMSQVANQQRKEAMDIMLRRLEEQEALIKRLNKVLKEQDSAMARMQQTILIQAERLKHIDKIDSRMETLHQDQAQILEFTHQYMEQNVVG